MTVYAITDTKKKGEQGLRLLIFKLPQKIINMTKLIIFTSLLTQINNNRSRARYATSF